MNRTDDISNLFSRFGASSDGYHEFESRFDYKETPLMLRKGVAKSKPSLLAAAVAQEAATRLNEMGVASAPVNSVPLVTVLPAEPPVVCVFEPSPLTLHTQTDAAAPAPLRHLLDEVALARQAETRALNEQALSQVAQPMRVPKCSAHIVALVSLKGGVGKTTLSASLASSLRLDGGQTLAIDLDPQNALYYHLGVESGVSGLGNPGLPDSPWNALLLSGFCESQVLPYGVLSADERSTLEHELSQDRFWLARQLDCMALSENDVVIIDTPSGRSVYLEQALEVADQVIVVTCADAASFITLDQMDRLLGAADTRLTPLVCHYVVNQFDASREFSLDMLEVLKRRLGEQLQAVIALDNAYGEALAYGHNSLAMPDSSVVRKDVLLLCEQLKARFDAACIAES